MKKLTVIALALLLSAAFVPTAFVPAASAAELAGVTMPDTMEIGGKECKLVGMGIRKKFSVIKVYVFGLYMENPSMDPVQIISSDEVKGMFIEGIGPTMSSKKIQSAWRKGFKENTPDPSEDLTTRMDKLVGLFTEEAKKGDTFNFTYVPGQGISTTIKKQEAGVIPGVDIMKALVAIWFGDKPADKGLKKSVLKGL